MPKLPTLTLDDVLDMNPCYTLRNLKRIAQRRKRWSLKQILRLKSVPWGDRLWVVLNEEVLPEELHRLLALDCACRALVRERKAGREPDARLWAAVEVVLGYTVNHLSTQERAGASDSAADVVRQLRPHFHDHRSVIQYRAACLVEDAVSWGGFCAHSVAESASSLAGLEGGCGFSKADCDKEKKTQLKRLLGLLDWYEKQ